ncbi:MULTISPECIES: YpuI family protein [Bacillaceae]|uniref:YpuI family protein n=1 Tax=Bacillaceae TaxID=186817 RepID=UPI001A8E24BE|nr:YpuI family protein [Bacillus sp. NTK034]MBN8200339.1 YpuI family protein [Bacillus sp. NTK034]
MGNSIVKSQMEDVKNFLGNSVAAFEDFLNNTTIKDLETEKQGNVNYYKSILSHVRKLLVYCEEGLDTCKIILKSEPFQKGAAEKTLYRIYHQCIEEFFSPKNDAWFENSRSAYTGKNSIQFHEEVPDSLKTMFRQLEGEFQRIREELEYYETDYRTKMIQSK